MKVYMNGKFIDLINAEISPLDAGFLYGEGAFETMRSFGGRIPFAGRHYGRLMNSLNALDIRLKLSLKEFLSLNSKLLSLNRLNDACLRFTVSAGSDGKPTAFGLARKLEKVPAEHYVQGVSLCFSKYRKNNYSELPGRKTLNYLENLREKRRALKNGSFDAVFLDATGGYITECSAANVFIVKAGQLFTPPVASYPVLPGITREVVIGLARENGVKVSEKKLAKTGLFSADEVFITNARIGILPVKEIGGRKEGESPRDFDDYFGREILRIMQ